MNQNAAETRQELSPYAIFPEDAFSRADEADDRLFYATDRLVPHLDATALATVERIIGRLITEEQPVVLDLMASWDSHLPAELHPRKVVGLGLNRNELRQNQRLSEVVIHDLNTTPALPFPDATFDVVLNTVSVDYLTHPFEVFAEVSRVLKPGGLFLVIFSNRMFPEKATRLWQLSNDEQRVALVTTFFDHVEDFEPPKVFISRGRPRPQDDRYAALGLPSDPIYAVYAEKQAPWLDKRERPEPQCLEDEICAPRKEGQEGQDIRDTLCCPHCGERMNKWEPPNSPFSTWDTDYLYICFNDECPYVMRGWGAMDRQGNRGMSYRLMYDPRRDSCLPIPIISLHVLREGIVGD